MTEDQIIEDIFEREGTWYEEPPKIDQPTGAGGIVLDTLTEYLGRPATVNDLKALTKQTATPIVRWKLHKTLMQTQIGQIPFEPLRLQVLDFYYNSGTWAIKWLQKTLRVADDGVMGPKTMEALATQDLWLVNQAYIAARLQMIDQWTDAKQQRKAWEEGLESRGLKFSLIK